MERKNGTMRRPCTSLAVGAAALVFAAGVALPDTASAQTTKTITTKYCMLVESGSLNTWFTTRDNWVKVKFQVKQNGSSSYSTVKELHTENSKWQRGRYKCTSNATYTVDLVNQHYSGKAVLDYGPDITYNASADGPYCFGAKRNSDNHVDPWSIYRSSGC